MELPLGLLSSLGNCGCEGPGELPGLRLGGEPDQEGLLLSGVRSAEIGLLSCVGDCGSRGDCDQDLECLKGMKLAEVGCGGVCNIPVQCLSGDGVLLSPHLLLILAEWTSVICWWYRLNGLLSSLGGDSGRGALGEKPGLHGGEGDPKGLNGSHGELLSGVCDKDLE